MGLHALHQFSQCQQGMEGDEGDGRSSGRGDGGRLQRRYGPGLGDADGSYLWVVDDVTGRLAVGRFEDAFDDGRLAPQRMIRMYNPHNLRMFYRYRGFI